MSGGGGYLLSGFTVAMDNIKADSTSLKPSVSTLEPQEPEEPAAKKRKCPESGS